MRRILIRGTLLSLCAAVASAAPGVNLRWSQCLGDGGTMNRSFACNTNTANHILTGSFEIGAPIAQASGNEVVIDLAADAASIPAWWQFKNAGTCRPVSASINFTIDPAAVNCLDWTGGSAAGGIGAYDIGGVLGPNMARFKIALAVPLSDLASLSAGQEYFSFNLVINSQKTAGDGACAGCTTPVCIVFASLRVTTPVAANGRTFAGPTNGTDSNYATWQGGGVPVTPRGTGCPAATPTRNATWGSVKSLYRN